MKNKPKTLRFRQLSIMSSQRADTKFAHGNAGFSLLQTVQGGLDWVHGLLSCISTAIIVVLLITLLVWASSMAQMQNKSVHVCHQCHATFGCRRLTQVVAPKAKATQCCTAAEWPAPGHFFGHPIKANGDITQPSTKRNKPNPIVLRAQSNNPSWNRSRLAKETELEQITRKQKTIALGGKKNKSNSTRPAVVTVWQDKSNAKVTRRKLQNVNSFEEKQVKVGAMTIPIYDMPKCCTAMVGKQIHAFCSFACYVKCHQQTATL